MNHALEVTRREEDDLVNSGDMSVRSIYVECHHYFRYHEYFASPLSPGVKLRRSTAGGVHEIGAHRTIPTMKTPPSHS
jgi:hypothetical protein